MIISSRSWHYRLWKFGRESQWAEPRDLCRYFWHIFLIKLLAPGLVVALAIAGLVALILVIWNNPVATVVVLMFLALAIALIVGIILLIRWRIRENRKRPPKPEPEEEPEPSVLFEFLKARKQKLCPLIEVKRE